MVTYSSEQFFREWRYSIGKEFVDEDGNPFQYSPDGKQEWGDESELVKFEQVPSVFEVSDDRQRIAVAVGDDIHVLDRHYKSLVHLRAHIAPVSSLAFMPGSSDLLVSSVEFDYSRKRPVEPTIILWSLQDEIARADHSPSSEEIDEIGRSAVDAVSHRLAARAYPIRLQSSILEKMTSSFTEHIRFAVSEHNAAEKETLNGRLLPGLDATVFSPSGEHMVYMPGDRPPSNGDNAWDLRTYSIKDRKDALSLVGHRENIMWAGYDLTEKYIGTVSWDRTSRLWNAQSGELLQTFRSEGQNWKGAFSPDSKLFASTCGDGSLHVYAVEDGSHVYSVNHSKQWCRALSWSPCSRLLVVGERNLASLFLVDVIAKEIKQERELSAAKSKTKEETRRVLGSFIETNQVKFVDGGRKLVFWASGDASAEVLDLKSALKWRFARAGTQSYVDDPTDEVPTSRGGRGMKVWEDREQGLLKIASVDFDATRIWHIGLDSIES